MLRKDPGGCIMTVLLGIAGSVVSRFIATNLMTGHQGGQRGDGLD